MFSIGFLPDMPSDHENEPDGWYGEIQIGEFSERFISCLSFWSKERYQAQWKDAVTRIVQGEPVSALVTDLSDPTKSNYLFWWPIYRKGKTVIIHNQILFMNQIEGIFNPDNPYQHVGPREILSSDGTLISEWFTTIENLQGFLRR